VYLIDAMSYIFRAYHARTPQAFTSPSGEPTQAVFLFNNMLRKLLREHAPDYVAVAFESGGPTVRDEIFEDYKAQRPSAPDDLVAQIEPIKRLCQALRLKLLEHEGYEADDVIATLAEQARGKGLDAVVVTSDKDMLQLVRTKKGATVHQERSNGPGLQPHARKVPR
jgi:DNA polymerase-1